MAVFPQYIKMYAELDAVWTDITSYVLGEDKITGYWGHRSNRELDRVAAVGKMNFTLNNSTGLFAPNLGTALSGWGKGTPIKLVVQFREVEYIKFYGTVDSLRITGGALGLRRVYVTVKDWMDFAEKYPLVNPGIQENKTADEAMTTIVAGMPIQPQETDFEVGNEVFPTIFDAVTTKTRASSEFTKLALSEMGYVYLRKEFGTGENLRFEKRTHRTGVDTPTSYTVPADPDGADGFLLDEDGTYVLFEDGGKIVLEDTTIALEIDNNMQDVGVEYGNNLINRLTTVAYPRKVDTSLAVLFSLGYPMQIGSLETIEFRASYFDPTGGSIVNAISDTMEDPVITTDYLMNTEADGGGSNISSDLVITATYGTEGVTYSLTNNNAATGYITKLQARGYGVYTYTTLESVQEDQPSIDLYGYHSETLHQMYQQNTNLGKVEGKEIIEEERVPRTVLNSVALNANKSADLMFGYLRYDVGDLVPVVEDVSGIDSEYYIQGVNFSIQPAAEASGVIDYGWIMKQAKTQNSGYLAPVAVEFDVSPPTAVNYLNFGSLVNIQNLVEQTISLWAKIGVDDGFPYILGIADTGNNRSDVILQSLATVFRYRQGDGLWTVAATGVTNGDTVYHHFVVTKTSTVLNTAPLMYVNGVSKTVTTTAAQTVHPAEDGYNLAMGRFTDGTIEDMRVYNRILTPTEVTALYNDGPYGTGNLSDLQFQAPFVKNSDLSYFTNHVMLETDRIIDAISTVGVPFKSVAMPYPTVRLP